MTTGTIASISKVNRKFVIAMIVTPPISTIELRNNSVKLPVVTV